MVHSTTTIPAAARLISLTGTSSDSNWFTRSKHQRIFRGAAQAILKHGCLTHRGTFQQLAWRMQCNRNHNTKVPENRF